MFVGMEKLSLVDYDDKVACILFKSGCNFRCPFCHNSALVIDANYNPEISFSEILDYLKNRKGIIDAVVISGGEPTLDLDLKYEIREIKKLGYLVKLDTNGTRPHIIRKLLEENLLDYVAMDIKNSLALYPITCGIKEVEENKILESISILKNSKIDYEFRTTIIEEFHDEISMIEIGQMLKGAKKLLLQKFVESENNIRRGLNPVNKEKALIFKGVLQDYIDFVDLRGY